MQATFAGTERYRTIRALGEGGMGQVYEVHDGASDRRVALKTLRTGSPLALHLFKNEFRALADLSHPNLVGLYELGVADDGPFFTMELVDGAQDLVRTFRGPGHNSGRSWLTANGDLDPDATLPPRYLEPVDVPAAGGMPEPTPLASAHLDELPALLGQLAEAIATLHAARKLHRDIKPSNILVTAERRVVLVDFGLVASLDPEHVAHKGLIAGSVPYMSPEQSLGAELTAASDWYAFGAVLYELLTGRPPFAGARAAVLAAKRGPEVVPPSEVVPGVPEELDSLCVALLSIDPAARPTAAQVLRAFGRSPLQVREDTTALIGRDPHLAQLDRAMDLVDSGQAATLHLSGHSGMGKSALTTTFLDRVRARGKTLVLSARCYERDHVPFKAIDPLVDALMPWLETLSRDEVSALTPRHIGALCQLFPVLERIEPFAEAVGRIPRAADRYEEQRRAFEALRELLARVGDRLRLVVAIDDLQWADRDSAETLRGLLRPPDPPTMLLLLAYRSEAVESSLALRWLDTPPEEHRVHLGPLDPTQSEQVVRQIHPEASPQTLSAIAAEAEGSPFFLTELAHRTRNEPDRSPDLEALILDRVGELPDEARRLLEIIALAGVPVTRGVAAEAAGGVSTAAVTVLQSSRLIRSEGPSLTDRLECYHDRVRETVVAQLGPAPELHRALADALERTGTADSELLCTHLVRAGDPKRARRYAREAAAEAMEGLAFDRAAANLRVLMELLGPDDDERGLVMSRLGEALANAGRGSEAGDARLAAAALVRDPSLRRTAAVNYLWSGRIADGRALMLEVLADLGVHLPRSRWGLILAGVWHRLRARLRPLSFTPRPNPDPKELERVRALADAGFSIVVSDQDLAFSILARFVTEARALGDPGLFATSMAAESFISQLEPFGIGRGVAASELGHRVAAQLDDPLPRAWLHQFYAVTATQQGHLGLAHAELQRALAVHETLRDSLLWVGWCRMFLAIFEGHRTSWAACETMYYQVVADARAREDIALEVHTVLGMILHPGLFRGDVDLVEREVEDAIGLWQQDQFDLMHFYATVMRLAALSARGHFAEGLAQINRLDRDVQRSGAMNSGANITQWCVVVCAITAGAVLDGVAQPSDIRRARRLLAKDMTSLGWRRTLSGWSGAALHRALGDDTRAVEHIDAAILAAGGEGMHNIVACLELQRLRLQDVPPTDPAYTRMVRDLQDGGLADPVPFLDVYSPVRPRARLEG